METEPSGKQETPHMEPCYCREFVSHLASAFGIKSNEARDHLRNARIEVLKAVRSIIDDRIEHLSRAEAKGTKVPVE